MISDIMITISQAQIKEQGYRSMLRDFRECTTPYGGELYYMRLPGKPKRELDKCFLIIGGAVRYQATVVHIREAGTMYFYRNFSFETGECETKELFAKAWLVLADFVKLPRPYERIKGFQGFRYVNNQL